jgi:hypothetical protein
MNKFINDKIRVLLKSRQFLSLNMYIHSVGHCIIFFTSILNRGRGGWATWALVTVYLVLNLNWILVFNVTFSNISAISWRPVLVVEEARVPREPPTMGKQLVNFITCGCESSAPFLSFTKPGANPRRIGDRLVWVCNPTT